ncbi:MAG: epoxyqueuosine reductase QueH [Patescibacteria group bacterium]
MKKLLFHICCAPCATYVSRERLAPRYELTWYFYNPNLLSAEEYERRLDAVRQMADQFSWPLIIEPYDHAPWQAFADCRAADPERGLRCRLCYADRLARTARLAREKGFDLFGTSLAVSPYKDTAAILSLGQSLAAAGGPAWLAEDLQSDNAFRNSQALARELGLYRQKFCGCEYSLNPQTCVIPSAV